MLTAIHKAKEVLTLKEETVTGMKCHEKNLDNLRQLFLAKVCFSPFNDR